MCGCAGSMSSIDEGRAEAIVIAHVHVEEKSNFIIVTRFFIQSDCEFEFSIYGCSFTVDSD